MSRRRNKQNRSNIQLMEDQPTATINESHLAQAESVTCDSCGNHTFVGVMLLKRISPIISPTGKEAIVPIQTFACNACGFVNKQFLPIMDRDEEET